MFLLLCSILQGMLLPPQVCLPPAPAVCGCRFIFGAVLGGQRLHHLFPLPRQPPLRPH